MPHLGGSKFSLGYFYSEEEAARVYDVATIGISGMDVAVCKGTLNFPAEDYEHIQVSRHTTLKKKPLTFATSRFGCNFVIVAVAVVAVVLYMAIAATRSQVHFAPCLPVRMYTTQQIESTRSDSELENERESKYSGFT